ncbi:hypothetical protein Tco_0931086, partial [Tanacetum coccineum]
DGLKYGLAAGLSQPAVTDLPAETVAGLLDQPAGFGLSERIEKTKRSKNDQKPTRNERDKKMSEETAKDQSRISRHSKKGSQRIKLKSQGLKVTSFQSSKAYWKF